MAINSRALDLSILILLGVSLVFAIVELGLTAWWVNIMGRSYVVDFAGTSAITVRGYVLPEVAFLLFVSIWGILASALLIALPFKFRNRAPGGPKAFGFGTLAIVVLTMIFWLAGFAAYADYTWYGYARVSVPAAVLALAIMCWLIYLALTVIICLTAFGVVRSERQGYQPLFGNKTRVGAVHTETPTPAVPEMGTNVERV